MVTSNEKAYEIVYDDQAGERHRRLFAKTEGESNLESIVWDLTHRCGFKVVSQRMVDWSGSLINYIG